MKTSKITFVFDLDDTVINSRHRTPNFPDGTLNLQAYIESHTPENVAKDTLLPLADTMRSLIQGGHKVAIITARFMKECDYEYLRQYGIRPRHIYSRDRTSKAHQSMRDGEYKAEWIKRLPRTLARNHIIMFDDAKPVKSTLRKMGVTVLCGHKVNAKLQKIRDAALFETGWPLPCNKYW